MTRRGRLMAIAVAALNACANSPPEVHARVVRPLAASDAVCAAVQVAIDSVTAGRPGRYVVLQTLTDMYNTTHTTRFALEEFQNTPGLLASTWRSFTEQNATAQATCGDGTRSGAIRHEDLPKPGNDPAGWYQSFRLRHPDATGWVSMSGPGLSEDGNQLCFVIRIAYTLREGSSYVVVMSRDTRRAWKINHLAEHRLGT